MLPLFFMSVKSASEFQAILGTVQQQTWVQPGTRVLVACSGGMDSVLLLQVLNKIPQLDLGVAHLNHGLRGQAAASDAEFVRDLAGTLNLPFYTKHIELHEHENLPDFGVERVARQYRYEFLREIQQANNYDLVATGHTGSDLIETILLNVLRGTGVAGLRGIQAANDFLVRPLLGFLRHQVEIVVTQMGFEYREDASNAAWDFTRNRIRHGWLKAMNSEDSHILLSQVEEISALANALVDRVEESSNKLKKQYVKLEKRGKILLEIPQGVGYFSLLWKALFDKAFQHVTGYPNGITEVHFENLREFMKTGQTGQKIDLPGNCEVYRERHGLCFTLRELDAWSGAAITVGQTFTGPFFQVQVEQAEPSESLQAPSTNEQIIPLGDATWQVRPWQNGDTLQPFGHTAQKKVSDLLQSAGVAAHLKPWWPVVEQSGEILWIPGVKPSEQIRIKHLTDKRVRMKIALETGSIE